MDIKVPPAAGSNRFREEKFSPASIDAEAGVNPVSEKSSEYA
jgi:hypothetical protein